MIFNDSLLVLQVILVLGLFGFFETTKQIAESDAKIAPAYLNSPLNHRRSFRKFKVVALHFLVLHADHFSEFFVAESSVSVLITLEEYVVCLFVAVAVAKMFVQLVNLVPAKGLLFALSVLFHLVDQAHTNCLTTRQHLFADIRAVIHS